MSLIVVITQQVIFFFVGLYRGIWRFSSMHDLKQVVKAVSITLVISPLILYQTGDLNTLPRSIIFLNWFVMIVLIGGGRFVYRFFKDQILGKAVEGEASVVVGAGSAGEKLAREFANDRSSLCRIVGFVDDDHSKQGRQIHGIKVCGRIDQLKEICTRLRVKKILVAIPSADSREMRRIINHCDGIVGVEVRSLPSIKDLALKASKISQLREIHPEDLLGREPVSLNVATIGKANSEKVIFVSGAGGSIGSELCFQLCKFKPSKLILFELSEFALYEVHRRLEKIFPEVEIIPFIGDIRDEARLERAFREFLPQIVYHAAAFKHVPLMEDSPYECFRTNVLGTMFLTRIAEKFNVDRFVMVSTDKAVKPTNVMGATKRIAEMICQDMKGGTKFMTVRFGNVLGSNGSVIPLFQEQIKNGGPVTVTHKDITRYFMSIPEAAQLIMQAGSIGSGGEIFVLDMGEPVRIYDLARELIILSGFTPDIDIEVQVTGLRPGEKLYEELFLSEEKTLETSHPLVRVACARVVASDLFVKIDELRKSQGDSNGLFKKKLKILVEEYEPYFRENNISEIH
jgi:FlaA1/EpsC-like NDP-sugar epimerase